MANKTAADAAASLGGTIVSEDGTDVDVVTGEIVKSLPARLIEDTRNVDSYEAALAAIQAAGGTVDKASEFEVLDKKDKATLVGVPFVAIQWRFNTGDMGEFVSVEIITKDKRKLILNDGSTGIYAQLKHLTEDRMRKNPALPLAVALCGVEANQGLRVSEFDYTDDKGNTSKAQTYYIQGLFTPRKD